MAIYKEEEITALMLRDSFPSVVAELQEKPEITIDSIRASHPDIVAAFTAEGAASVNTEDAAVQERERVVAIQALNRPGAESIITAAIADSAITVNDVKIQLFDHDSTVRSTARQQHLKDGESLAGELKDIKIGGADNQDDKKTAKQASHDRMIQKAKGAK